MAIITLSRQVGSSGDEIASELADKTGYILIDKNEIHDLSARFEQQYPSLITDMEEEHPPGLSDKLFIGRSVYKSIISGIVYDIASQDRMIIKGRGAQFLLKDYPGALCVRIIAPFDCRVATIQKKHGIGTQEAEQLVNHLDQEQARFIHYLYQNDISDQHQYDFIYNSEKLGTTAIVENLAFQIKMMEKECPMTDEDVDTFKNLAIAKQIEANIRKELSETFVKVIVTNRGDVTLSGYLFDDKARHDVEQKVQSIQGVKLVHNNITLLR